MLVYIHRSAMAQQVQEIYMNKISVLPRHAYAIRINLSVSSNCETYFCNKRWALHLIFGAIYQNHHNDWIVLYSLTKFIACILMIDT